MSMRRPIVVEGPDGAGKSTLCRDLAYVFGMEVFHTGGPLKDADEAVSRVQRMKEAGAVIFDRVPHISERVYGPLRPDGKVFEVPMNTLAELNPIVILCVGAADLGTLEEWVESQKGKSHKPEELIRKTWEDSRRIQATYRQEVFFWLPMGTPILGYDYHRPMALATLVKLICMVNYKTPEKK